MDVEPLRVFGESRHANDLTGGDDSHVGSAFDNDGAEVELKIVHRSINFQVGREGILSLGNANSEVGKAKLFNLFQFFTGSGAVRNHACAIEVGSHF